MAISGAEQVVLISAQFVLPVRAQAKWSAKKILGQAGIVEAQRTPALADEK